MTLRPLFLNVTTAIVGRHGGFGMMTEQEIKSTVETFVTCIDEMMTLSEHMYEEKLYSNHRQYHKYKEEYEQKKDLLRKSLFYLMCEK